MISTRTKIHDSRRTSVTIERFSVTHGVAYSNETHMKEEYIEIEGKKHPVEIHLEKRRSSRVSIGKKAVYIRIPDHLPLRVREEHIRQFKEWAYRKLVLRKTNFPRKPEYKSYKDGDELVVGNISYTIRIHSKDKKSSSARIVGNEVRLSLSSSLKKKEMHRHVSVLLNRCFARKMLPDVRKRVSDINKALFGFPYNRVLLKNTKSRWGSCSSKGNLNFSTRLLVAPRDVFDYVIVHELAHLKHRNHGNGFWRLVESVMPHWREKRKWLRKNQDTCRL